jgi:hypothetical protein
MQEITFGQYALPAILSAVMALVFMICKREDGTSCLADKWKNLVVIGAGLGLGLLSILYTGSVLTVKTVTEGLLSGFFCSMSAVGLWKTLGIQITDRKGGESMKALIIGILMVGLLGCSTIHEWTKTAGELDIKNAEATKQLARDMLKTWSLNSGIIRGALGEQLREFPASAVEAMDELDKLASKIEWTDQELGYSIGYRLRMLNAVVQSALKLYAPDLLKMVPGVLGI